MNHKKLPHGEQAERIILIARRLFADQGVNETSLQDIAQECGIRKASLYYHFKSKEMILKDIFEREMNRNVSLLNAIKPSLGLEETLYAISSQFLSDFDGEERSQIMKILLSEGMKNGKTGEIFSNLFKEQGGDPVFNKLQPLLEGKMSEKEIHLFVFTFLGVVFNFAMHTKLMKHEMPFPVKVKDQDYLRFICQIYSRGL